MSDSCDPMDWSPPGSFVHGNPKQEYWSGLSFYSPGESSRLTDQTCVSCIGGSPLHCRKILYRWATKEALLHFYWLFILPYLIKHAFHSLPRPLEPTSYVPSLYFFFISWRLITLQYCSGFCHTLTWISHGYTCIPHPDPLSHLPLHPIRLGLPSAPGPSTCLTHPAWAGDLFHHR